MIYKIYGIQVHKDKSILQAEETTADKQKAMQKARKWREKGLQSFVLECHKEIAD